MEIRQSWYLHQEDTDYNQNKNKNNGADVL